MKKLIIVSFAVLSLLAAPIALPTARAQVVLDEQHQLLNDLLLQVIQLLTLQVQALQAQLAALEAKTDVVIVQTTPAPVVSAPVPPPAPAPTVVDPASQPQVSATTTVLADGQVKIEWLATQRDNDPMSCSSPEIGKIGTQGVTIRPFNVGNYSFSFECVDQITGSAGSGLTTFSVQ